MWFFKKNNKEDLTEEITPRDKELHIESDKDDSNEQMIWMRRMISHNIKMPMSIISGYAELLKQGILVYLFPSYQTLFIIVSKL